MIENKPKTKSKKLPAKKLGRKKKNKAIELAEAIAGIITAAGTIITLCDHIRRGIKKRKKSTKKKIITSD